MTGSSLILITIPVAGTISLAAWLILVFWADSHPRRTPASPAPTHTSPGPAPLTDRCQASIGPVSRADLAGTGQSRT